MIHIYCGDGKGKTTASVGLLLRASGAGKKVMFVQFLKDGSSSEINNLKKFANVLVCPVSHGFYHTLPEKEKLEVAGDCTCLFEKMLGLCDTCDMIILDEVLDACSLEAIDEERLYNFLLTKKDNIEIVLTGRNPSNKILDIADYVTEMKKIKHPFDKGAKARKGIEM